MKGGLWKLILAVFFGVGAIGQFQRGDLGMLLLMILLAFSCVAWFCYTRYKIKEAENAEAAEQQRQREAAEHDRAQRQRINDLEEQSARIRLQMEQETLERFHRDPNKQMAVKVVGVTFENEDGTDRQEILEELDELPGYMVEVKLEPYTYRGEPAVRVLADGRQIGNVPKELAAEISERFGSIAEIGDFEVVGGDGFKYGARFAITFK